MKKKIPFLILAVTLLSTSLMGCNNNQTSNSQNSSGSISSTTEAVDPDVEAAQAVIDMINALSDESTEEEINAVVAAFNNLTSRQKNLVTNIGILEHYVQVIEAKKALASLEAMIEALDENDPDPDDVLEARKAYANFVVTYGEEWIAKINQDLLVKLYNCEIKVCSKVLKPLFQKALTLDLSVSSESVQFTLLSQRIDELVDEFPIAYVQQVDGYDDYIDACSEAAKTNEIVDYTEPITFSTQQSSYFMTVLDKYENDDYGYTFNLDLSDDEQLKQVSNDGNIQFGFKADMRAYKKIAFFISWPLDGSTIKVLNHGTDVYVDSVTIEKNTFKYFEIPTSLFTDISGDLSQDFTHIAAYLVNKSQGAVDGYKLTNIVGIGINADEAQAAVDAVDAMIEALNEDSEVEAVEAARKAYNDLLTTYSQEWQNKVKPENIQKLIYLEKLVAKKVVDNLIATANAIELSTNSNKAQFVLLGQEIEEKYEQLEDETKTQVVGYDTYLANKVIANKTTDILFSDQYYEVSNDKPLPAEDTHDYGKMYYKTFESPKNPGSAFEIKGIDKNADWSTFNSFGLFIKYDAENTENVVFCPNAEWGGHELYCGGTLIDAEQHLYYYEFPLNTITSAFNKESTFAIYFSNVTNKATISGIVCFYADVSYLNSQINRADNITLNNNKNITRFITIGTEIESTYNSLTSADKEKVVGYSDYLTKKASLGSNYSLLWNTQFTVEDKGGYPDCSKIADEEFGAWYRYDYDTNKTVNFNLFANANGQDWSSHKKFSCFIQLSEENGEKIWFILKNDWTKTIPLQPEVYDAERHIYYCEFDLSDWNEAFTGNPFFSIYLTGKTSFVATTALVALDA